MDKISNTFTAAVGGVMAAVTKLQFNPMNEELGQVIQEKGAPTSEEISELGVLKGKTALVVGGTRGSGYGTALAFAQSGASVTIVGRSEASGSKAVSKIMDELPDDDSSPPTTVKYLQGDIGTVASTKDLVERLTKGETRYDYLVVTAAIFPQPQKRNPSPLNDDGVEKSFGIAVVGRFLLYRNAHSFMTPPSADNAYSPMILNVCAAGCGKLGYFNRKLVFSLGWPHMLNIMNFAVGNELMLHKLVSEEKGNSDGTPFQIPIISTHPGYLKTDLHRGQGIFLDFAEGILVHFMGSTEEVCGRREVSILCAIGKKQAELSKDDSSSMVTIVDNFGFGRLMNKYTKKDLEDHGDWLWGLLVSMEAGGNIDTYKE